MSEDRDEKGRFVEGSSGNPNGRPPETEQVKITKRAIKELVKEYKEDLAQVLPDITPILIDMVKKGDMQAIKELHDRVMGKPEQSTDITSGGKPIPLLNALSHNDSNQEGPPAQ